MREMLSLMFASAIAACAAPAAPAAPPPTTSAPAPVSSESAPTQPLPPPPTQSPLGGICHNALPSAPAEFAGWAMEDLPQGFQAMEREELPGELPGGFPVERAEITYQRAVGGQVSAEDEVHVQIFRYASYDSRQAHLDLLAGEGYRWESAADLGAGAARYSTENVDGRAWCSGSFLIVVFSGPVTSESAPWVEDFARMYLDLYPPS